MRLLQLLLVLLPLNVQAASFDLEQTLADARARKALVLVDFHAPWCYSCYYMAQNVLTGDEWARTQREMVVMSVDADSPEGAALRDQWQVKALPSYVVLDASGEERGRILGEQTRADFYAALARINASGSPLAALQARAAQSGMAAMTAGREALAVYHARRDAAGGLAWFNSLSPAQRQRLERDAGVRTGLARLHLLQSAAAKDAKACLTHGEAVLAAPLGCERAYELNTVLACTAPLADARQPLLQHERPRITALVDEGALGRKRCADQRSVVLAAADLYTALADKPAEASVLTRAIEDTRTALGEDLRKNRNLADNLRMYLDRAGRVEELDALLPRLVEAYPQDYVYAFRHGRSLLARGQAAQALPWLERAAPLAYGLNRLKVAEQRVLALQALKRERDARRVVAEALKANGPWFPEDTAKLKALIAAKG